MMSKGIERGIEKGTKTALLRLLRVRFGALDATIETRVEEATSEELDRWLERLFAATSVDEIFAS